VRTLAGHLARRARYAGVLTEQAIDVLARSAPLHDIGKVGIPDHILLKPGRLDPDERAVMETHAALGADAIARALEGAERRVDFLTVAMEIARHHHERWDGSGYPDRLAGEEIPLSARLMAIADVFDALISRRVYKPPMPFAEAYEIIVAGRGSQFDPDVVDSFVAVFDEMCAIASRYRDEPLPAPRRSGVSGPVEVGAPS
jgi:putative two-component system response regulator